MTDCDVLIVGGGPAGLSVASALPKDLCTVILHQDAEIGLPVRTSGGTWVRDMVRLGVPDHLYQVIDQLDFFSDTAEARFAVAGDTRMAVLDITGLYRYLAALSDAHNRTLLCGTSLTDATILTDRRVAVKARSRSTGERQFRARMLIDASGWKMAALEPLRLARKPARTGVGFEYEFERGAFPANRAILFVGSAALQGYGWVFPAPGDRLRLGIGVIQPDTGVSPRDLMTAFEASDEAERMGFALPKARETHAGIIPSEPYDRRLVWDAVVRVGDSANMATPTVGEGIRIAIEEGRALGAALAPALGGDRRALLNWEKAARRRFARNYHWGLMMNRRIAGYAPERWDRSVRRLSRLGPEQMVALVRSEFSPAMVARTAALSLLGKLRGTG